MVQHYSSNEELSAQACFLTDARQRFEAHLRAATATVLNSPNDARHDLPYTALRAEFDILVDAMRAVAQYRVLDLRDVP